MVWTWAAVKAVLKRRRSSIEHRAPFSKLEADPRVKLVNAWLNVFPLPKSVPLK
jgi:hypothetical protein